MLRPVFLFALAASAWLTQLPGRAVASPEQWQAISNTAASVTGTVAFAPDRITFQNGKSLPFTPAVRVPATDVNGQRISATPFQVTQPDDPVLQNGNRLCGGRTPVPVTYIAVWHHAPFGDDVNPRDLAAFSGGRPPARADSRCATYSYKAASAGPVQCPDIVAGHRLGEVDFFNGPPADNYLMIPSQPGKRDIWPSLDKMQKPVFVICHYQGGESQQFQLPRSIKSCTALRAPNDVHTGLTCQ